MNQTVRSTSPRVWHSTLLAVVLCLPSCADTTRLSTIRVAGREVPAAGHVQVERDQRQLPASAEMILQRGDTISTSMDTTLVVRSGDTRAVLMPNTKVSLGSVFTWFGRVFISGWLQGKTKLVNGAVKGTQYVVEVDEKSGLTTFSVLEGTVHVSSVKGLFPEVVLMAAQRVRVPEESKQPPSAEPIERGEYNTLIDAANRARDATLDQLLLPDLTGDKIQEAEALLRQAGFQVSRREVVAPAPGATGVVVGQVPPAGTASRGVVLLVGGHFKNGPDGADVTVPSKPKVLAQTPFTAVQSSPAALVGPNRVKAGTVFTVKLSGPRNRGDLIVFATPDKREDYDDYGLRHADKLGDTFDFQAPAQNGAYELRYRLVGGKVLARLPFEVVPSSPATLVGPNRVKAGTVFTVKLSGPRNRGDLIVFATPDKREDYDDYGLRHADKLGDTFDFQAPAQNGAYELRYRLVGGKVLARLPFEVVPSSPATLVGPNRVKAGTVFTVKLSGPRNRGDLIVFATPDKREDYDDYGLRHADKLGDTFDFQAPAQNGAYELRYRLVGGKVLARLPFEVVPSSPATLVGPNRVKAGTVFTVKLSGPRNRGDLIVFATPDKREDYDDYGLRHADKLGDTFDFQAPAQNGAYELRYRLVGGKVLARLPFEVVPSSPATLVGPNRVKAGTVFTVKLSGPRNRGDLIVFATPDKREDYDDYGLRHADKLGDTFDFQAPAQNGAYELRYRLVGGKVLARLPFEVVP